MCICVEKLTINTLNAYLGIYNSLTRAEFIQFNSYHLKHITLITNLNSNLWKVDLCQCLDIYIHQISDHLLYHYYIHINVVSYTKTLPFHHKIKNTKYQKSYKHKGHNDQYFCINIVIFLCTSKFLWALTDVLWCALTVCHHQRSVNDFKLLIIHFIALLRGTLMMLLYFLLNLKWTI